MTFPTSSTSTFQTDNNPELRLIIYRYLFLSPSIFPLHLCWYRTSYRRPLAIMRTNRQIHGEASSLWYSELRLIVQPMHIRHLDGLGFPGMSIDEWERNPLQYISYLDDRCPVYAGSASASEMEPYVFNRFKKLVVWAKFDPDMEKVLQPMDDDCTVEDRDEARQRLVLPYAALFNNIFCLLRNSLSIERLSLVVDVNVPWSDDILVRLNQTNKEKYKKLKATANKQAVDIFLEYDLLGPIRCLTNVKLLEVYINMLDENGQRHQPRRRYSEMLEELKQDVERNWLEHQKMDNIAMTRKVADMISEDP